MENDDSTHENSVSEIDKEEMDEISKKAEQNVISSDFLANLKTYIMVDDLIKSKQKEIKELKDKKTKCEDFIIESMVKMERDILDVGSDKITKKTKEIKEPLKIEIIKEAIMEKAKESKLFINEVKYEEYLESVLNLIDVKRPVKQKQVLERKGPRNESQKSSKTKKQ